MKIYLAPIMGCTDAVYRGTFARYFQGVDLAVSPFVSSVRCRKLKPRYLKDLFPENNQQMQVVPQILSNDPEDFLFMAQAIQALGYETVNWNLGCPTPMIAKKNRGSGLLPYPDRIQSFLDTVIPRSPVKISIKTRLGRHNPDELLNLLPILEHYPLAEIIIHPRLGVQMYNGSADIAAFKCCRRLTTHKLIYNGDITKLSFWKLLQAQLPDIDGWMIGRGLLANPFLAAMIKTQEPSPCLKTDRERDILKLFHHELFQKYQRVLCGPAHLLGRMKGFWAYYAYVFTNSRIVVKKINKMKDPDHYLDCVSRFFETEELAQDLL